MTDFADMTPSRLSAFLHVRGLGELGTLVQRRFQTLEFMVQECHRLQEQIKELESLLPDDVKERRRLEQEERAAAARNRGSGIRRAPAESDG